MSRVPLGREDLGTDITLSVRGVDDIRGLIRGHDSDGHTCITIWIDQEEYDTLQLKGITNDSE
jgi:hypothetical protein